MERNLHLGAIIKAQRKKLKLTAEALARKAGIDRTYISKIENHNLIPSWEILVAIGRELKTDLHTLYFKQKHPGIIYDKAGRSYKEKSPAAGGTQRIRNEIFTFISKNSPKHYSTIKAFAINILSKYKPSETNNNRLITRITQHLKKIIKEYQKYQKLYDEAEYEIIKLISP